MLAPDALTKSIESVRCNFFTCCRIVCLDPSFHQPRYNGSLIVFYITLFIIITILKIQNIDYQEIGS